MVVDTQGHVHSACLHWDGFPRRLWELLSAAGYLQPPIYDGHEFVEDGVRRCSVTDGDPAAPAQRVGADHDSDGRSLPAGHLGAYRHEGDDHFLLFAPSGGGSDRVRVVSCT